MTAYGLGRQTLEAWLALLLAAAIIAFAAWWFWPGADCGIITLAPPVLLTPSSKGG